MPGALRPRSRKRLGGRHCYSGHAIANRSRGNKCAGIQVAGRAASKGEIVVGQSDERLVLGETDMS